jgi:hypothetical protein
VIDLLLVVLGLNWGYVACLAAISGFALDIYAVRLTRKAS